MEKLFTRNLDFKLVEKKIKFRVVPFLKFGIIKNFMYSLPDSSYGEWVILENNYPKYYFCSFDKNGDINKIAKYAKENNLNIENLLIELLKNKNQKTLSIQKENKIGIRLDSKSTLQEVELLEIV